MERLPSLFLSTEAEILSKYTLNPYWHGFLNKNILLSSATINDLSIVGTGKIGSKGSGDEQVIFLENFEAKLAMGSLDVSRFYEM